MRSYTGATEDAASGRAARPGGTRLYFVKSSYYGIPGPPKKRTFSSS
jgi:hypothetical protein